MLVIPALLVSCVSQMMVFAPELSNCECISVLSVAAVRPLHVARWDELQR